MANSTETKRQSAVEATVNDKGHLVLTFANGKTLTLDPRQCTSEVQQTAKLHGFKQKLVDAAAIGRDPKTGRSATVDDKYSAVKEVYDRLLTGAWNAPRESGTGAGTLLYKALCRVYANRTPEAIREWLDKRSDAEKAALRANPKIAEAIAAIQAEQIKADPAINSDELLSELGD